MSNNLSGLPTDQSESACADEDRHLTRLSQFCYIFFCLNALFFGYLGVVNPNIFYISLVDEDGIVENLTFVAFLLGSVALFAAALAARRIFPRCVYVLGGIALLFLAGEEISYGQRIIGFETPDFLVDLSVQREFNIHNLETFNDALAQRAAMFMLCVAACAAFFLRKDKILGISTPPILLTLALLVTMTYFYTANIDIYRSFNYGYRGLLALLLMVGLFSGNARLFIATAASLSISLVIDHLRHHEVRYHGDHIRFEEISEYLFGLFCFFYALYLLLDQRTARQKIAALVAAFKPAAAIPSIRIKTPFLPAIERKTFAGIKIKGEALTPWTGVCALIIAGSVGLALMLHLHYKADAAALEETRSLTQTVAPAALSDFDVYIDGRDLHYFKQSCTRDDAKTSFFLGVFPVNVDAIPVEQRQHGFENLDFGFGQYGQRIDGACAITVRLPDYEIARVSTGQYNFDWNGVATNIWIAEFPYYNAGDYEAYAAAFEETRSLTQTMAPAARSDFDVYIDGRDLRYFKQSCTRDDATATFFLGIFPQNVDDLPVEQRPHGFENKGFAFGQYGQKIDDECAITVRLPDYEIASISTGQYTWDSDGVPTNIWIAEFPMKEYGVVDTAAFEETLSLTQTVEPAARSNFDVYIDGRDLHYFKQPCVHADADAPFFLGVFPQNVDDLPVEQRPYGFENNDFAFEQYGQMIDGACAAKVTLPDYEIANVSTGQYTWDADGAPTNIWIAEFSVNK